MDITNVSILLGEAILEKKSNQILHPQGRKGSFRISLIFLGQHLSLEFHR